MGNVALRLMNNPSPAAMAAPNSFMWAKCRDCFCISHLPVALPMSLSLFCKAIQEHVCPECGAGHKRHFLTQGAKELQSVGVNYKSKES